MSRYKPSSKCIGRLAPSPTGLLHLGNAWSFLIAWLACRLENGKIYLRMEDIDPQRSKKKFAHAIEEDLKWLGIDWDSFIDRTGKTHATVWQSERYHIYEENLQLIRPYVYRCYCTRKELREMAGAPQESGVLKNNSLQNNAFQNSLEQHNILQNTILEKNTLRSHTPMPDIGAPYRGLCRNLTEEERIQKEKYIKNYCLRLACPYPNENNIKKSQACISPPFQDKYSFDDCVLGKQEFSLEECGGDFALKRSDGVWAYQLAVVSDDRDMGITQIVRGSDILMSTPRQLYLYDILNASPPQYAHIPLLHDENGERLAKRHKSLSLASLRERKGEPKSVISYLANLMGFTGEFANAKALLEHIKEHELNIEKAKFPWEILRLKNIDIQFQF